MMYLLEFAKKFRSLSIGLSIVTISFVVIKCPGQSYQTEVEGNGLFRSSSSTNLDILNTDENTNALLRFGDNGTNKVSLGFNGNENLFKISMGTTLGREDLTISQNGLFGVNAIPESARLLINHNSTSGTGGSAHLSLREDNFNDFARLKFENSSAEGNWQLGAWATDGLATMRFSYDTGQEIEDIITLDGEQFRAGIHQANPEGYLHIKQASAGVDAIVFENDPAGSTPSVDWRIGDTDILIYFDQGLRAAFDAQTGTLNSFPLVPSASTDVRPAQDVLQSISLNEATWKHSSTFHDKTEKDSDADEYSYSRSNNLVKSNNLFALSRSEKSALLVKAIQERQVQIEKRAKTIAALQAENQDLLLALESIEQEIKRRGSRHD